MSLHIEPLNGSAFPDPKDILQFVKSGRMHFTLDSLTLALLIDKAPDWNIKLHLLPGTSPEMDECILWKESAKEIKAAMDQIVRMDAVVSLDELDPR
jgi:hypothetical protein